MSIFSKFFRRSTFGKVRANEPRKLSKELLVKHQKELEIIEAQLAEYEQSGVPPEQLKVTPDRFEACPESALFKNGEFLGHPLDSELIDYDEIIPFLEVHRDQSVWFSVACDMHYGSATTRRVISWMLEQPDCDAAIASLVFGLRSGPEACGLSAQDNMRVDRLLLQIEDRERSRPFMAVLGAPNFRVRYHESTWQGPILLEKANAKFDVLDDAAEPALSIPEGMLKAAGSGRDPIVRYCCLEDGLLCIPRQPSL